MRHAKRSRQPLTQLDPWRDQLDGLLLENAADRRASG
jgi:hypothetical protein